MVAQNTSHINDSIIVSDSFILEMIHEMRTNYSGLFQITSVGLDLFASFLASIFTIRFYHRIEISHPLYAVIFMDIVISTATSYLSIILFLVNSIIDSDTITFIDYGFSIITAFKNVSSFMMIAFIRYYLLVHVKTNENEEEIDMIQVKKIFLIMNCVVLLIIFLIRGGLHIVRFIGYDVKLAVIACGICLMVLPLILTLILNRKIDTFLKFEHDENDPNVNNPLSRPEEDENQLSQFERSGRNGKHERPSKTKVSSAASSNKDRQSQRYGGIYIGETSINSPDASNMNKNEIRLSTIDVNTLPNQVIIEKEDQIHNIESNDLSEDKTVSLHSNDKTEHRANSNLCNLNTQNNAMNIDENEIEVLESIDDVVNNFPPRNMIFPADPLDNDGRAMMVYNDSREHKSISKFVNITSLLLLLVILSLILTTFIRVFMDFDLSKITNVIIFMVHTIFLKLLRTFLVIVSSVYCFELVRSLFSSIINETVELFQLARDRFTMYL